MRSYLVDLTYKTLILAFIIVNFFNFFPINIFNPIWINKITSNFVDTASLPFLGLIIKVFFTINQKKQLDAEGKTDSDSSEIYYLKIRKIINKLIIFFILSLTICLIQALNIFRGITFIDYQNNQAIKEINSQIDNMSEKAKQNNKTNSLNPDYETYSFEIETVPEKIEIARIKANRMLSIKSNEAKIKLFQITIRNIILSILWSTAFFLTYRKLNSYE